MPRFAIAHRVIGSSEPPTYYCIDGLGRILRVGNPASAAVWDSDTDARHAIMSLGLSGDPEVFVADISARE